MRACSEKLAPFIGTPWESQGRDAMTGCDCWGIVLAAARECYGLDLPDYTGYDDANDSEQTRAIFEQRAAWAPIPAGAERAGDVIVLKVAGAAMHAGLIVGGGFMLHSLPVRNACLERYDGLQWRNRVEGIYRWSPR